VYAKLRYLESFCNQFGVSILECACIGDGANDFELFKKTQKGITFVGAPEAISREAWHVVTKLTDIKSLL
jgi:phosphoserine phosphatase